MKAQLSGEGGPQLPSPFALFASAVLGPGGDWRHAEVRIKINPVSASRPRVFRNGGVGYSKSYTRWRKDFVKLFPDSSIASLGDGPFCVVLEHVFQKPKTTKLAYPRGDLDNLDKGPLDSLGKAGMLPDDNKVVGLMSTKRWTKPGEEGHTDIIILWSEESE